MVLALCMPLIICIIGFTIDGGLMYFKANRLAAAVKIAALEITEFVSVDENGEVNFYLTDEETELLIQNNLPESSLVASNIANNGSEVFCTIEGSCKVEFSFMKIFGIKEKILYSNFTATKGIT